MTCFGKKRKLLLLLVEALCLIRTSTIESIPNQCLLFVFEILTCFVNIKVTIFHKISECLFLKMSNLNPQYEQIGKAFVEQYYNIFDNVATRCVISLYDVSRGLNYDYF